MKKRLFLTPVAVLCLAYAPSCAQDASAVSAAQQPAPVSAAPAAQPGAPATQEAVSSEAFVTAPAAAAAQESEGFVVQRETLETPEAKAEEETVVVTYNPKNRRDPTLSPDDFLLLQYREQQRLAALEAERQRKLAEERRKREEAERLRQLELARIKDPTREVRNKIRVGGIIGQEVFIGSRIYTVGKSIYGARIVEVRPDEVVFSYKGHKFIRKVQLK